MIVWTLITLCSISLISYLLLLRAPFADDTVQSEQKPNVSILIAVRNEEKNLKQLLKSIELLDYPKDRLDVLIGDDESTDQTWSILKESKLFGLKVFSYIKGARDCTGKQFVLEGLLKESSGEVILFTDGDVELTPSWVKAMLVVNQKIPTIKVGVTRVKGGAWFAKFQNIDWLMNQFMINVWSGKGVKLGVWGNNMSANKLVKSLNWPITDQLAIVEDIALMKEVLTKGGKIQHCFSENHLITTKAESSFMDLMEQRKRWLNGAIGLPIAIIMLSVAKILFMPVIMILASFNVWFLTLWLIKLLFSVLVMVRINKRLNQNTAWWQLILFDFYEVVVYISTFAFYLWSSKVNWKGRKY
ncbi:MAG: glycosyltransferase [Reichenbachiella sp.]